VQCTVYSVDTHTHEITCLIQAYEQRGIACARADSKRKECVIVCVCVWRISALYSFVDVDLGGIGGVGIARDGWLVEKRL
jgi:hypothetical protein